VPHPSTCSQTPAPVAGMQRAGNAPSGRLSSPVLVENARRVSAPALPLVRPGAALIAHAVAVEPFSPRARRVLGLPAQACACCALIPGPVRPWRRPQPRLEGRALLCLLCFHRALLCLLCCHPDAPRSRRRRDL